MATKQNARGETLWQWQCQREGTIFYYQHAMKATHIVRCCPVCGSKRVDLTGRTYVGVNEMAAA